MKEFINWIESQDIDSSHKSNIIHKFKEVLKNLPAVCVNYIYYQDVEGKDVLDYDAMLEQFDEEFEHAKEEHSNDTADSYGFLTPSDLSALILKLKIRGGRKEWIQKLQQVRDKKLEDEKRL